MRFISDDVNETGCFQSETTFVAHDNNEVLTVKLGHETSLVTYSTDKRSKPIKRTARPDGKKNYNKHVR